MKKQEAIDFLENSTSEYVTYGLEASDLGTPVERKEAIKDISLMDDEIWADGDIYECDKEGYIL